VVPVVYAVPDSDTVAPTGPLTGESVSVSVTPANVAVAVSPTADPVAVTVFGVPPLLNANPFELVGVNVHDPPPPLAEMVQREVDPIVTAMLASVDVNPAAVAVTMTPLGPDGGLSVRLGTVPVNVAVPVSPELPIASTVLEVPSLLNAKPVAVLAVKVQPEKRSEPVQKLGSVVRVVVEPPAGVTVSVTPAPSSDEEKSLQCAVTVTPLGPDDGESVSTGSTGGGGLVPGLDPTAAGASGAASRAGATPKPTIAISATTRVHPVFERFALM
jgi:hypothetical protein